MKNQNTVKQIEEFLSTSNYLRNAFFWSPPKNAAGKRSMENRYTIPEFTFTYGKDIYTCELSVSCSCSNVYVTKTITKNGKITNITPVKNVLKKMLVEAEQLA
jgi:hypothetical protein